MPNEARTYLSCPIRALNGYFVPLRGKGTFDWLAGRGAQRRSAAKARQPRQGEVRLRVALDEGRFTSSI